VAQREGTGRRRSRAPWHPKVQKSKSTRAAVISVHTSPLSTSGTGDAGGRNVYIVRRATDGGRGRSRRFEVVHEGNIQ